MKTSIFGTWRGKDLKKKKIDKLVVISALEKLKQEVYEFQAVLSTVRCRL